MQTNIAGRPWQKKAMGILMNKVENGLDRALMVACPGAGKTRLAIAFAKTMMDLGAVNFIVVMAPSDNLRTQWRKELSDPEMAGFRTSSATSPVRLDEWEAEINQTEARVYTFQSITGFSAELRKLEKDKRVLLIVDEGHHAGDALPWSKGLIATLSKSAFKLMLSGTPWRSDQREMPFVSYDENGNALPDYAYTRAQALVDGKVVREAVVVPINAFVEGETTSQKLHPKTFEVLRESKRMSEGYIAAWSYGEEIEEAQIAAAGMSNPLTHPAAMLAHNREAWERKGMPEEKMAALAAKKAGELRDKIYDELSPNNLVDPALLLAKVLNGRINKNLSHDEARKLVEDSGIMGIKSDPRQTMRMMWDDDQRHTELHILHDETVKQRQRYKLAIDTNRSEASRSLLTQAHERLVRLRTQDNKHRDPRAGGLVVCENKAAARSAAILLTHITGTAPRVVLSDVEEANNEIALFRDSDEEWVVTVKMISEGVDIKRLRVLAYLSNVMSELFLAQVLGRITRWRDDISQEEQTAYFYALAYPPLLDMLRLIDAKVLTQAAVSLSLPRLPPKPIECSPLRHTINDTDLHGCDHIAGPTVRICPFCATPLKAISRRASDMNASEISRAGTLWRGRYAEEAYVELAEWMVATDDVLAGVSEQLVAVISKHVRSKEALNIWKAKGEPVKCNAT